MNEKIARFFAEQQPATPCLVVDLDIVEENFRSLTAALPDAKIYYAVKANPAPEILSLLAAKGSSFDTASVPEIEMALAAGATPDRISFGNTIKKQRDIAKAYELGVRLFAFDSIEELEKIAESAPGSRVFCRILTSGEGAEWPAHWAGGGGGGRNGVATGSGGSGAGRGGMNVRRETLWCRREAKGRSSCWG